MLIKEDNVGLSEEDLRYIALLKEYDILVDVKEHLLDQSNGVILVSCGDGDQMYDIFLHQVKMQNGQRTDPRIHTLTWNGGAIRLTADSPANELGLMSDITFMREIANAARLKNIKTTALNIHGPCGATSDCGMSFKESMYRLIEAKYRIKKEIPGMQVACFCHLDYGDRKRTKFVWKQQYEKCRHLIS